MIKQPLANAIELRVVIIPVIPSSRWESAALASSAAHPAARQKVSGRNPHDLTSAGMDAYPIRHDISRRHGLILAIFFLNIEYQLN